MPDYYVFHPESGLTPITAVDAASAAEYAASEWGVEVGETLLVVGVGGVERFSTVLVGAHGATVERRSGPS